MDILKVGVINDNFTGVPLLHRTQASLKTLLVNGLKSKTAIGGGFVRHIQNDPNFIYFRPPSNYIDLKNKHFTIEESFGERQYTQTVVFVYMNYDVDTTIITSEARCTGYTLSSYDEFMSELLSNGSRTLSDHMNAIAYNRQIVEKFGNDPYTYDLQSGKINMTLKYKKNPEDADEYKPQDANEYCVKYDYTDCLGYGREHYIRAGSEVLVKDNIPFSKFFLMVSDGKYIKDLRPGNRLVCSHLRKTYRFIIDPVFENDALIYKCDDNNESILLKYVIKTGEYNINGLVLQSKDVTLFDNYIYQKEQRKSLITLGGATMFLKIDSKRYVEANKKSSLIYQKGRTLYIKRKNYNTNKMEYLPIKTKKQKANVVNV